MIDPKMGPGPTVTCSPKTGTEMGASLTPPWSNITIGTTAGGQVTI